MSERIVGISNAGQTASVHLGDPCFGRKRKQIHIQSPQFGRWIVSVTDRQARALTDAMQAILESGTIRILVEEVPHE
jgi:hypothetical protein